MDKVKLKCFCGSEFERPSIIQEYSNLSVFLLLIKLCPTCHREKVKNLKNLPTAIELISKKGLKIWKRKI